MIIDLGMLLDKKLEMQLSSLAYIRTLPLIRESALARRFYLGLKHYFDIESNAIAFLYFFAAKQLILYHRYSKRTESDVMV